MFKDSKSGQTHFEDDGCGEPAHNTPEKWEEEFDQKSKTSYARGGFLTIDFGDKWELDSESIKSFIRQAISEAVEEERKRIANCLSGINWTHSQTGIAIGTKKAVIAEALLIFEKL